MSNNKVRLLGYKTPILNIILVLTCGVKGAEREVPGLQAGDESGAALYPPQGELPRMWGTRVTNEHRNI